MRKCKHKVHTTANVEIGGYNIPDGCTTEYDIVCKDCGEYLGHWAYGYSDLDYHLKYELKFFQRIKAIVKIKIHDILWGIKVKRFNKKYNINDNNDLPF